MHKLSLVLVLGLLASVAPSLAAVAASSVEVHQYDGDLNRGSYIVKVRDGAQKSGVMNRITSLLGGDTKVTHDWDPQFFNGFAGSPFRPCACVVLGSNQIGVGTFGDSIIEALKSNIDVEYIAEDGIMKTFVDQYVELWPSVGSCYSNPHARNDAPWNLARVSTRTRLPKQDALALDYVYQYLAEPGRGVDIYVVDTGLFFVRFRPESISTSTSEGVFVDHVRELRSDGL
jgi:hypothetical protein